ncbi:hypothetical protein PF010_g32029, partial [Phytophthora fragariae]
TAGALWRITADAAAGEPTRAAVRRAADAAAVALAGSVWQTVAAAAEESTRAAVGKTAAATAEKPTQAAVGETVVAATTGEPARAAVGETAAAAAAEEPSQAAVRRAVVAGAVETVGVVVEMAADDEAEVVDALMKSYEKAAVLQLPDAIRVLASIFNDVTAYDISQKSGRTHGNAGELLPVGVADMLAATEPLHASDVFLDIGAGIGNVLAQVALTTTVRRCIGVEVRAELCSLAIRQIRQHTDAYPQLRKVAMKAADVRDVLLSTQPPTSRAKRNAKSTNRCFDFALLSEAQIEVPRVILCSLEAHTTTE